MSVAIFFDMDGVLVDAAPWHYLAFNAALREFGFEISAEEHAQRYNGLPTRIKLEMLSKSHGLSKDLYPKIQQIKQQMTEQIIVSNCKRAPKTIKLLERLKNDGHKLAVCSNAIRSSIELILGKLEITHYFGFILSNEDVLRPKPDPEIYLKAVALSGYPACQCMAIEDTELGVSAALAAGIQVFHILGTNELSYELIGGFIRTLCSKSEISNTNLQ